jgi:hypothetical protein
MEDVEDKELVDLKTMAKMLGIHPDTLRDLHLQRVVRSYRIGKKLLRFAPKEVREDIRQQKANKRFGFK